ncbi:hypothetical protein K439DRAFT_1612889 [Ramaria rubella]|nr:hypothetical protein K439DRAFT_1612889 [Ramaria rubella]
MPNGVPMRSTGYSPSILKCDALATHPKLQACTSPKLRSFEGTGLPPLLPSAPQPPLPPVISGYFACSCPLHASKHSLNLLGIIRHCSPLSFLWLQSPASAFSFTNNPSTPERDRQEERAREHEQRQMTSTTNRRECAAAATADRILHQQPPPPHPFPHLALQQPQRHSGDPFVQPPIAGSSHIPNPQTLNPSPRDQVADICAQLAAIQQQQPLPARRWQPSAVQPASNKLLGCMPRQMH